MILVDTSVWVGHLRKGSERLHSLLTEEQVLCHPFVVGELACGTLRRRPVILDLLRALPQANVGEQGEVLRLLEAHRLYRRGLGWVDAHLLASALLTPCRLWTFDKPLWKAAAELAVEA